MQMNKVILLKNYKANRNKKKNVYSSDKLAKV